MPQLIIAKGENNLCSELLALQVPYQVENLPVGDIEIREEVDTPIVIIERKTVADLMASIVDGRYKEQSTRLQAITAAQVWWIIEGNPATYRRDRQAHVRMCSAIASLGLLRKFTPVRTANTQETAILLKKLLAKAGELPQFRAPNRMQEGGQGEGAAVGAGDAGAAAAPVDYHHPHKKFKSDCITRNNIQTMMLAQVPGVSPTRATAILEHISLAQILEGTPIPRGIKSVSAAGKKPVTIPKNVLAAIEDYLHPKQSV